MKKTLFAFIMSIAYMIFSPMAYTQTAYTGGRGMLRVYSANTVKPGVLYSNIITQSFLFIRESAPLGKDHNLSLGFTYGISNDVELTAQIVGYQDDQRGIWGPPGNTQIGMKLKLPFSSHSVGTGLRGFLSLPTAKNQNVDYEPYSSEQVAWGIMGLLTIDMIDTFPFFPFKFHSNLGYLDHNIRTFFSDTINDQILLGLGFEFPIQSVVLYTEFTGEIFYDNPNINFRNNSVRLTQGIKFPSILNLIFDVGVDFGLHRQAGNIPEPVHEYADWKVIIGASYEFTSRSKKKKLDLSEKDLELDKEMVEEIKKKRQEVAKKIEEMRKKIQKENEKKKKKSDKKKNKKD
ncbi:MAG: hypothetical protein O6940_11850 [Ignavibacteria bacterium]|nr:hypothetical protein [Ignavibacteria bacterium]